MMEVDKAAVDVEFPGLQEEDCKRLQAHIDEMEKRFSSLLRSTLVSCAGMATLMRLSQQNARSVWNSLDDTADQLTIEEKLIDQQAERMRRECRPGRGVVALNHNIASYWDHYHDLPWLLEEEGHEVIILAGRSVILARQDIYRPEKVYYFEEKWAKRLDFVDVVTSYNNDTRWFHRRTRKINLSHMLPFGLNYYKVNIESYIRNYSVYLASFDYIVSPLRLQQATEGEELWRLKAEVIQAFQGRYPDEQINHESDSIHIIPGGYPKLDKFCEQVGNADTWEKVIIFAPTYSSVPGSSLADGYAGDIVGTLLEEFRDHLLVMRVHPGDRTKTSVLDLVERFQNNPGFSFDRSESYIELYKRSRVLVTDTSATAITYALAMKRPVVFLDPSRQGREDCCSGDENAFGFISANVEQMVNSVICAFGLERSFKKKLTRLRRTALCRFGDGAKYVARSITAILNDEALPGWLEIPLKRKDMETNRPHMGT